MNECATADETYLEWYGGVTNANWEQHHMQLWHMRGLYFAEFDELGDVLRREREYILQQHHCVSHRYAKHANCPRIQHL